MHYRKWQWILNKIKSALDSHRSDVAERKSAQNFNIIDEIKEKLMEKRPDVYVKWKIKKFDINYLFPFKNGYENNLCTLLNISVCYNLVEVVNALLAVEGINVNAVDYRYGATPLHFAARSGYVAVVEALLAGDAKVNARDGKYGITPLHGAVGRGHIEIVEILLVEGADVNAVNKNNETPLHIAVDNGHTGIIELLLANDAEVNARDILGRTPLHLAARSGHTKVIEVLLLEGAGVNIVDGNLATPLHLAAGNGHIEGVKILLEKNSNEIVNLLLQNKIEVDAIDQNNETPLHLAVRGGYVGIVNVLLAHKAKVNVVNRNEEAPLHLAARNGYTEIVRALLRNGANSFLQDKNSQTSRDLAVNDDVTQLLKRAEKRQRLKPIMMGVTTSCLVGLLQAEVAIMISRYVAITIPMVLIVFAIVAIALATGFIVYEGSRPHTRIDEMQAMGVYYNSYSSEVLVI
ncbi:ankyrin repeat domain-containing protein [Wolbachia endosymbiont of Pentalonia nigronervosa]|jgi:cytohesin|uniref:ankyrin repeat domain-containing protein n=1 Tax=Wolbachia endosymbiont of Pentalonia nigronervosa TaxID=1301914 RepID=UPI00165F6A80|nr:ankyrin repeat domain-containing protein [Wolbachia endosymbiont of Pentalonia nigronervosa]MBD0391719.1 ankyrin repeat domain-containing protein [Wolbachia endosymbiont of Pentalonia nigronervosa]